MTDRDDRLAHLAILEELAELVQRAAAVREHEHGQVQADLIRVEEHLQAIITDPGSAIRRGEIVCDGNGRPVANEAVRRRARETLERVRRDWARLTGEAREAPTGPPGPESDQHGEAAGMADTTAEDIVGASSPCRSRRDLARISDNGCREHA
jgi:hypothetical protein